MDSAPHHRTVPVDLTTSYLGLSLRSPIVASASPLTGEVDTAIRIARAGAGALVLPSLFEEEITAEELETTAALEAGSESNPEASGFFPDVEMRTLAERYLANLGRIRRAVDVPVIASLNATSVGAWCRYAALMAEAGADAVELNVYRVAADPRLDGATIEVATLELVAAVCRAAPVPVAVKLSPFYSGLSSFAARVVRAGAAGLVLFNRFYQPDLDLETMEVRPRLELSTPAELRLPLRWIAILRPQLPGGVSLAATSGVSSGEDVAKALAVGADVVMTTSELLRSGPERVAAITAELRGWLAGHGHASVAGLRGRVSKATAGSGEAFERANYRAVLRSWTGGPA